MQASIFTEVMLPLVLAFIMFGMGLTLKPQDFLRLVSLPKAALIGLLGQLVLLPVLAFLLAIALSAPPAIAIGMMILAACPGGTTSNLISHAARANLALSVSLTAVSTLICIVSTPLIIRFAIDYFDTGNKIQFSLVNTSVGLLLISLLPIIAGMFVSYIYPHFARRSEKLFRNLSIVVMIILIAIVAYRERSMILGSLDDVLIDVLALNIGALLMAYGIAIIFKLQPSDQLTIGIEVGTQNGTLAIMIALSFIQIPAYAVIAGVYSLFMYLSAAGLILLHRQRVSAQQNSD